ncbi:hypothetical protein [Thalassotalea litorea]|uniref:hypothetical protein n=1 Tax=Thalassotalea litorea TaxID=2020715 RepID=UPI003734D08C
MTMEWQSLTKTQKFLITLALIAVLPFAPELLLIADIAGIEVLLSCLVIYYRPLLLKLQTALDEGKKMLGIVQHCVGNSSMNRPGVYFTQTSFYTLAVFLFGTGSFALIFLMPGLLISG